MIQSFKKVDFFLSDSFSSGYMSMGFWGEYWFGVRFLLLSKHVFFVSFKSFPDFIVDETFRVF